MLLTLSARSLVPHGSADGASKLDLLVLPRTARELEFSGLSLSASVLARRPIDHLDRLRDEADKAGTPCLLLMEDAPQALGALDPTKADAAVERVDRLLRAAHRLGCSAIAFPIAGQGLEAISDELTARIRALVARADRLEVNVLLAPGPGLTATPEQMTALIRKIGGFRIGAFPDFQAAFASPDAIHYLRNLAPYASALCASTLAFDAKGRHPAYDLDAALSAIQSVGFTGTLTVEYRGPGDPRPALAAARALIASSLASDLEGPGAEPEESPAEEAE